MAMTSRWCHSKTYNDINAKIDEVKTFIESNEVMLDHLTVREKTFLKWNLHSLEELIMHGIDTVEDSSSYFTSSYGNTSQSSQNTNADDDSEEEIFSFEAQ